MIGAVTGVTCARKISDSFFFLVVLLRPQLSPPALSDSGDTQ